ncbi:hypothetical protein F3F96_05265 [Mariprofundus sp. NF]|uniref:hypothetical protein n=1 Tax=Mariprofundus sp. NF TaxID=2608716 RepID=UPI0015A0A119|nr:hypothetical protein [Mariprofundus sp. NF]NWF38536.1 hypothetical protein [Mariprofundus sp. NF]
MITILDFEASGLEEESYPIQVAWNIGEKVTSFLLNPETAEGWDWWNSESELVHGIPRAFLIEHGHDVSYVASVMLEQLSERLVYSDAVSYDSFWCHRLFEASGVQEKLQWRDFWLRINEERPDSIPSSTSWECGEWRRQLKEEALRNVILPEHKADNDVRIRMEIFRLATSG